MRLRRYAEFAGSPDRPTGETAMGTCVAPPQDRTSPRVIPAPRVPRGPQATGLARRSCRRVGHARTARSISYLTYTCADGLVGRKRGIPSMLVVTTENVPGYRVRDVKGQVFGVVVRSRGLGGNIMAGLRSLAGGEITEYTQLLEEARRHAVDRMVKNATLMQANAIVMMRFDSAEIGQTMSEIVAYGTAVVLEKANG